MNTFGFAALSLLLCCPPSFAAAVTDFSITRTISADAQAGSTGVQAISGSATGLFNETRTETDAGPDRSAKVTAFQSTEVSLLPQSFEISGAMFTRSIADGDAVQAVGRSEVSIFFTIDGRFSLTIAGTAFLGNSERAEPGNEVFVRLFSVVGTQEVLRETTGRVIGNGTTFSINREFTLEPGRYHLTITASSKLAFPEYVPQGRDLTASIYDLRLVVIPEPSVAVLVVVGVAASAFYRGHRNLGDPHIHSIRA